MQESIMLQAFELMVLGMGFVFVFLTLLVFATKLMSRTALRFAGTSEPGNPAKALNPPEKKTNDAVLIAVISSAIRRYRKNKPDDSD